MCPTIKHNIFRGYFTRKCVSLRKLPQGTLFLLKEKRLTLKTQRNLDMKRLQQRKDTTQSTVFMQFI